jgi:hypothetical protein
MEIGMDYGEWMHSVPLWLVFFLTLVLAWGSMEVGRMLARYIVSLNKEQEPEGPVGSLVGGISALLAFILGFTFAMTSSRLDTRKQLVLDQANAVGTTYLRAALVPPTQGLEIRRLLREYTDVLTTATPSEVDKFLNQVEGIHHQLWAQTKELVGQDMDSEVRSLFISSLNESIDLFQSRKTVALDRRIPGNIWIAVHLLTVLSMLAIGYQIGMSGANRLRGSPVLAVAFSLVILMIADIDRPGTGIMQVSQRPLIDLRESMLRDSP